MIFYIILLISYNYSNGETITVDEQLSNIENKIKHIIERENYINNRLNGTKNEINIQKNNLEKLLQKKLDALAIEQQNTTDKYNKLFGKKKQPNDEYNILFGKKKQLNYEYNILFDKKKQLDYEYNILFGKKKLLDDEYNILFDKKKQSNYIDYAVPLRVPIFSLVVFSICIMLYGFVTHLNEYYGLRLILIFSAWALLIASFT